MSPLQQAVRVDGTWYSYLGNAGTVWTPPSETDPFRLNIDEPTMGNVGTKWGALAVDRDPAQPLTKYTGPDIVTASAGDRWEFMDFTDTLFDLRGADQSFYGCKMKLVNRTIPTGQARGLINFWPTTVARARVEFCDLSNTARNPWLYGCLLYTSDAADE